MILTGDLHLTDRRRDKYRWKVFDQLLESTYSNESIVILGDLTDRKDRHPAKLVNRIVRHIVELGEKFDVWILKGNHDYLDANEPFFGFLNELPGVHYVSDPGLHSVDRSRIQFLPHTFDPKVEWANLPNLDQADFVFAHQTFSGAVSSTGQSLSGAGTTYLADNHGYAGRIYSGDIHVPQDVGPVTYVGTPYPVAFGDEYSCRFLRVRRGKEEEVLGLDNIHKHTVEIFGEDDFDPLEYNPGDQLKMRLKLRRSEFGDAQQIMATVRKRATENGLQIFGFKLEERKQRKRKRLKANAQTSETDADTLNRFCAREGFDKALREHGHQLLNDATQ